MPATKKTAAPPAAVGGLEIEIWPITRPIPYLGNARKLSDRAVQVVAASLEEFGWQQPLVCDKKDVVVVGHTRLLAAQLLAWETAPVHVARNLTPAQCNAYRLMDNRSNDEAEFNTATLGPQLQKLEKQNYNLLLTGFTQKELEDLLKLSSYSPGASPGENGAAPAPKASGPAARAGDVWLLGEHKLMLAGDRLEAVDALLEHWQYVTGELPTLKNGQSWADVKTARLRA